MRGTKIKHFTWTDISQSRVTKITFTISWSMTVLKHLIAVFNIIHSGFTYFLGFVYLLRSISSAPRFESWIELSHRSRYHKYSGVHSLRNLPDSRWTQHIMLLRTALSCFRIVLPKNRNLCYAQDMQAMNDLFLTPLAYYI